MLDFGPTSHTLYSQRLQLRYVDWGNRKAPPLLLVHGGKDHCRSWDWVAREFFEDWHVIAPDLRGHGDSAWSPDGDYSMLSYVYDLAQLIHQLDLAPVTIVAHSLGGNISLRYTGLFPDNVKKLVAIEGLGPSPDMMAAREKVPVHDQATQWIEARRAASGRQPKRYDSIGDALKRMQEANGFLSDEQARHLTEHGVIQNEDGTYSWKFDNYLHQWPPADLNYKQMQDLWGRITCPTLLCYGDDSWASNPQTDGRLQYFNNATVNSYENAGHWLHHDQFDKFTADLKSFL